MTEPIDSLGLAEFLLSAFGGDLLHSREFGGDLLHTWQLPNTVPIVLAESPEGVRLGSEIGAFHATPELWVAVSGSFQTHPQICTYREAVRDGVIRLWLQEPLDGDRLSPERLRRTLDGLAETSTRLQRGWAETVAYQQALGTFSVDGTQRASKLVTGWISAGGHDPWPLELWSTEGASSQARGFEDSHVWSFGQDWPVPVWAVKDGPVVLADWLDARYPPDSFQGVIEQGRILLCGAFGLAAFALEDEYSPERGLLRLLQADNTETLLDLFGLRIEAAEKGAFHFEARMDRGEFGWRRPFLFQGSTITGQGRISVWDNTAQTMLTDSRLTSAWEKLLVSPHNPSLASELQTLILRRYEALLP